MLSPISTPRSSTTPSAPTHSEQPSGWSTTSTSTANSCTPRRFCTTSRCQTARQWARLHGRQRSSRSPGRRRGRPPVDSSGDSCVRHHAAPQSRRPSIRRACGVSSLRRRRPRRHRTSRLGHPAFGHRGRGCPTSAAVLQARVRPRLPRRGRPSPTRSRAVLAAVRRLRPRDPSGPLSRLTERVVVGARRGRRSDLPRRPFRPLLEPVMLRS